MTNPILVPALDIDALMLARYGRKVAPRGRMERRIVAAMCAHLAEHGWNPTQTYDGDEWHDTLDAKSVMELVFNLDDSWVRFTKEGASPKSVRLITGNGIDIISDYTYNAEFDALMSAFDPEEYA